MHFFLVFDLLVVSFFVHFDHPLNPFRGRFHVFNVWLLKSSRFGHFEIGIFAECPALCEEVCTRGLLQVVDVLRDRWLPPLWGWT